MAVSGKKKVVGLVVGLTLEDTTACTEILGRLKLISNTKSDTALARVLGLKQSSISTAKARGMVPAAWIVNATNLFDVSADWLIYGDKKSLEEAPKKLQSALEPEVKPKTQSINDLNKITNKVLIGLSPDGFKYLWDKYWGENYSRRGWIQIELTKRFPEFLEWIEEHPELIKTLGMCGCKMDGHSPNFGQSSLWEDD